MHEFENRPGKSKRQYVFDGDSDERARSLSYELVNSLRSISNVRVNIREGWARRPLYKQFSKATFKKQAGEAPIGDVVADVGQMAEEFAIAREYYSRRVLCWKLDDAGWVPVSITKNLLHTVGISEEDLAFSEAFQALEHSNSYLRPRIWHKVVDRAHEVNPRFHVFHVQETEGQLESNLTAFLSARFTGMEVLNREAGGIADIGGLGSGPSHDGGGLEHGATAPPRVGVPNGLRVKVSCVTPGMRIHIAPAYFINWAVFGSPSTPVVNFVIPGRYVFAGDAPQQRILQRDNGVFPIPPTDHVSLVSF